MRLSPALVAALFVVTLACPDHAAAQVRPARQPGSGLLYYAKGEYASADNTAVIANPHICGALIQIIWSEVEKADGHYDWSEVDRWIKPWVDAEKGVAIRIMWVTSGVWKEPYYKTPTPKWVWEKGAKFAFLTATSTEIPLSWDPIYQKYALRFLEQFAQRYGDHPRLLFVDVTPGAETNPYRFGIQNPLNIAFKGEFAQVKASDGRAYSEEMWVDTVKEWIDASARILPRTPLLVTLNNGSLNKIDHSREIGEYCVSRGLYVGQNGLSGRAYENLQEGRAPAFLGWSTRTKLCFEMALTSGVAHVGTLMEVMQAAERIHCHYLNVYPRDVQRGTRGEKDFDPAYEAALKYGAEKLGK